MHGKHSSAMRTFARCRRKNVYRRVHRASAAIFVTSFASLVVVGSMTF